MEKKGGIVAQEDKDLKKKKSVVESDKSANDELSDANIDAPKKGKKNTKDLEKVLTESESDLNQPKKGKKNNEAKGLTSYEEQALQGVTKSKGNKKRLIILLLLLFIVIAGVGIAVFFMLRPEDEEQKAIVCEVEVLSYIVDKTTGEEEVIGSGDKFNFTKATQETSSFTKDVDATVNENQDFAMTYLVNNVSGNSYTYTLDFTNFQFSNCEIVVDINNGETYTISNLLKVVRISHFGDVLLEIKISGKDAPVFDENDLLGYQEAMNNWVANTRCDGVISLTLELS